MVGSREAEKLLHSFEHDEDGKVKAVLESIFSQLMLSDKDTISEITSKIKRRLNLERKVIASYLFRVQFLCTFYFSQSKCAWQWLLLILSIKMIHSQ